jgi:hypothetical protein
VNRACAPCGPDTESKTPHQAACTPVGTCNARTAHRAGGGPNDCDPCPVGTYCAGGGEPTVDCANGTWDHDSDSSTACALATQCLPGARIFDDVTPVSDRQCTACTSGTVSAPNNAAYCAEWATCNPGSRVSQTGTSTSDRVCEPCTSGLTSTTNAGSCTPWSSCSAGTERTSVGTSTSDTVCTSCEAGTYCPGGTTAKAACTSGTWDNDANSATDFVSWSTCPAGQVALVEGTATSDRICGNAPRTTVVPGFNGSVYAIREPDSNGARYLGGGFSAFNAYGSGGEALVGTTTATVDARFPKVVGAVYAAAADGSGGVYIGGTFSAVDGVARSNLAHLLSDGSLDSAWAPSANGTVVTIAVSGMVVYVGGTFTQVAGQTRNNAAGIGTNGSLTTWNPNVTRTSGTVIVRTFSVLSPNVYLGRTFTQIGGTARNRLALLATNNGSLRNGWNPGADNTVYSMILSGSIVYVGGAFSMIGGTERHHAAAVGTDGSLLSWSPSFDDSVLATGVSGSSVYLGGSFTSVNGTTRNRAAEVNTSGTLQA